MRKKSSIKNIFLIVVMSVITLVAFPGDESTSLANSLSLFRWETISNSQKSIWQIMSQHYQLANTHRKKIITKELEWFLHQPHYVEELTHNALPYIYYIYQQTKARNMPAELALLPMIESEYKPSAYNHTGASGLWQMMPDTASGFGLRINWWYDGRRSIIDSTKAALTYLAYLHSYFHNWLLAIAAYDSGEGTVQSAIAYNKRHHRPTDFWSLPLPMETKLYVPKLLALATILGNPHTYQTRIVKVPDKPFFSTMKINNPTNLPTVAKLAKTDKHTIQALNPEFKRWSTTPHNHYTVLVPADKAASFKKQLHALQNHKIVQHTHTSPHHRSYSS